MKVKLLLMVALPMAVTMWIGLQAVPLEQRLALAIPLDVLLLGPLRLKALG
jgi:hypothetical protein